MASSTNDGAATPREASGFAFRTRKNGEVEISHHGQPAAVLRGKAAAAFEGDISGRTPQQAQQLMARITGNYGRGNERLAAAHPRNRR